VARFKNRQCIDECKVNLAISRRYLEHVKQLSLVQEGLGSRLGLYFRVVGTHALGTVPSLVSFAPISRGFGAFSTFQIRLPSLTSEYRKVGCNRLSRAVGASVYVEEEQKNASYTDGQQSLNMS
jgi:hypothetical protein